MKTIAMIAGLVCYENRLAALFDTAAHVQLLRLDNGKAVQLEQLELPQEEPAERAQALAQCGVELLVCGAISSQCQSMLAQAGIQVRPFLCGEIPTVIQALLDDCLDLLVMPGCGRGLHGRGCQAGHGGQMGRGRQKGRGHGCRKTNEPQRS